MRKILLLILLLLGISVLPSVSHAADIFNFLTSNSNVYYNSNNAGGHYDVGFKLGAPAFNLTNASATASAWWINVSSTDEGNGGILICLQEYTSGYASHVDDICNLSINGGSGYSNPMLNVASGTGWNTPGGSFTIDTGHVYMLLISKPGYPPANDFQFTADANGMFSSSGGIPSSASTLYNGNPYFCLGTSSTDCIYTPAPTPASIALSFPFIGSLSSDFQNWVTNINFGSSSPAGSFISVQYGQTSSSLQYTDLAAWNASSGVNGFVVPKVNALFGPASVRTATATALGGTYTYANWFATVSLLSSSSVILATSTEFEFSVSPAYTAPPQTSSTLAAGLTDSFTLPSLATSVIATGLYVNSSGILVATTSSVATANCDFTFTSFPVTSCLTYLAESVASWFFVPSQSSLNAVQFAIGGFMQVPPASFFFGVEEELASTTNGPSSTPAAWVMPSENWVNGQLVTSTITLVAANAADIPFVGTVNTNAIIGTGSFANDFFNVLLDFFVLAMVTLAFYIMHEFLNLF